MALLSTADGRGSYGANRGAEEGSRGLSVESTSSLLRSASDCPTELTEVLRSTKKLNLLLNTLAATFEGPAPDPVITQAGPSETLTKSIAAFQPKLPGHYSRSIDYGSLLAGNPVIHIMIGLKEKGIVIGQPDENLFSPPDVSPTKTGNEEMVKSFHHRLINIPCFKSLPEDYKILYVDLPTYFIEYGKQKRLYFIDPVRKYIYFSSKTLRDSTFPDVFNQSFLEATREARIRSWVAHAPIDQLSRRASTGELLLRKLELCVKDERKGLQERSEQYFGSISRLIESDSDHRERNCRSKIDNLMPKRIKLQNELGELFRTEQLDKWRDRERALDLIDMINEEFLNMVLMGSNHWYHAEKLLDDSIFALKIGQAADPDGLLVHMRQWKCITLRHRMGDPKLAVEALDAFLSGTFIKNSEQPSTEGYPIAFDAPRRYELFYYSKGLSEAVEQQLSFLLTVRRAMELGEKQDYFTGAIKRISEMFLRYKQRVATNEAIRKAVNSLESDHNYQIIRDLSDPAHIKFVITPPSNIAKKEAAFIVEWENDRILLEMPKSSGRSKKLDLATVAPGLEGMIRAIASENNMGLEIK